MEKLPTEIKLSRHARMRIEERNESGYKYNTKNLMKSACRWYGKDDFIINSPLYMRYDEFSKKSSSKRCITDGKIEVIYNSINNIAITILNLKDFILPFDKYIKPEVLEHMENKRLEKKNKRALEREYYSNRLSAETININKDCEDFSQDEMKLLYNMYVPVGLKY